ncbi:glutamine amidotransferase [Scrofimicrobium canadense]|nr:glutamine amidotransferase [Scrofimicrobium canadense]
MSRFLMLSTRDNDDLALGERSALLKYSGLNHDELTWVRLERDAFPRIDLSAWDGIILCGSRFDVGAPESSKSLKQQEIEGNLHRLLSEIIARDFPFMGICYGLGLLTVQLGGRMDTTYSEDISAPVLTLTSEGLREPLLSNIPPRFQAYVGHHEAVSVLPPDMVTLVQGQAAPTQMIRIGKNVFATQFHPELDLAGIQFRIEFFADAGYYPPSERALVEERVLGVDTSAAHSILRNFATRYGSRITAA